jgi:hypothetical protein
MKNFIQNAPHLKFSFRPLRYCEPLFYDMTKKINLGSNLSKNVKHQISSKFVGLKITDTDASICQYDLYI